MEARKVAKVIIIVALSYFLIPSYTVAILIHMPFPNILFPPVGKYFMYNVGNYSCTEQSHEVEKALEAHGIHTYIVDGYRVRKNTTLKFIINNGNISYKFTGWNYTGHEWTEIDLGIKIPFDAVSMLPVNPDWFMHYKLVTMREGGWRGREKLDEVYEKENIVRIG